jgi:hypothetical protein
MLVSVEYENKYQKGKVPLTEHSPDITKPHMITGQSHRNTGKPHRITCNPQDHIQAT